MAPSNTWMVAYPIVEREARRILDALPEGQVMSTRQLCEALYSTAEAFDAKVQKRVFNALKNAATRTLAAYVTRGEPEKIGAALEARRMIWGKPPAKSCCATCGRPL